MDKLRKNPHLVELNALIFLKRLSQKHKKHLTLADIPQDTWKGFAERGFDLVWLMGLWKRSPEGRQRALTEFSLHAEYSRALPDWSAEDIGGSPYAVYDYSLDHALGPAKCLGGLKKKIHQAGLKLIVDFVPNHLALDHPWTVAHPDYFVRGARTCAAENPGLFFETPAGQFLAHGKDPYFLPWTDAVQVNYFSQKAREKSIEVLLEIAEHADGARCDMAMLGLSRVFQKTWGVFVKDEEPAREFWQEVIQSVRKKFPHFVFIAEAYWDTEWELQQLGFDFTYDKKFYDRLRNASAEGIRGHLNAELEYQEKSVRFIENHDEPRAVQAFGREKSKAAAAIMATVPGLRFFHDGQAEGRSIKLPVQLNREPHEAEDVSVKEFYGKLFEFSRHEGLHYGHWHFHPVMKASDGNESYRNFAAHSWTYKDKAWLAAVNYSAVPSQARIHLPPEWFQRRIVTLKDFVSLEIYQRDAHEMKTLGLYVDLPAWGIHLFEVKF